MLEPQRLSIWNEESAMTVEVDNKLVVKESDLTAVTAESRKPINLLDIIKQTQADSMELTSTANSSNLPEMLITSLEQNNIAKEKKTEIAQPKETSKNDPVETYTELYSQVGTPRHVLASRETLQELQAAFPAYIKQLDRQAADASRELPNLVQSRDRVLRDAQRQIKDLVSGLSEEQAATVLSSHSWLNHYSPVKHMPAQSTLAYCLEQALRDPAQRYQARSWDPPQFDSSRWDQLAGWLVRNKPDSAASYGALINSAQSYFDRTQPISAAEQTINAPAEARWGLADTNSSYQRQGINAPEVIDSQNRILLDLVGKQPDPKINILTGEHREQFIEALRNLSPNISRELLAAYRRAGGSIEELVLKPKN